MQVWDYDGWYKGLERGILRLGVFGFELKQNKLVFRQILVVCFKVV